MSKSGPTTTAPRNSGIASQLPTKSAWSRGPPQSASVNSVPAASPSSRSQSPAPAQPANATYVSHSRKPSTLSGNPVAVGPSVNVPRSIPGKNASPVTFGSIDQPGAPLSSSPAAAPSVPTDVSKVRSFGSISSAALPQSAAVNGKPPPSAASTTSLNSTASSAASTTTTQPTTSTASTSTPSASASKKASFDVRSLFQNSGQPSPAPSSYTPDIPSSHSSPPSIPQPIPGLPSQPPIHHPYAAAYSPSARPAQLPRSPSFPRQVSNPRPGSSPLNGGGPPQSPRIGGAQPPPSVNGPGSGVMLGPPPPGPPGGGPPMPGQQPVPMGHQPMPGWQQYYYPYGVPGLPEHYVPQSPYNGHWIPPQSHMSPHHGHPQHLPPPPPHTPHQHQHGLPMSPRPPPPPLVVQPSAPPPPTPASPAPTSATQRLSTNAAAFVPRRSIVIKNPAGQELDLSHVRTSSVTISTPEKKKIAVRLESEEDKKKRLEEKEEKERKEREEKEKAERLEREKKEAEEKRIREEAEAKKREEEERVRKQKEEEEKLEQERVRLELEKERIRKEEEEREKEAIRLAEEERIRKEEEERERIRKEEEEKLELERKQKEEAEAREREKLEQERLEKERIQKEEEEKAKALELEKQKALEATAEQERTRVGSETPAASTDSVPASPRLTNAALASVEPHKRRPIPGPLDLKSAQRPGLPPSLPSALATARIINSLDEVSYPDGIKSPQIELNVNAKDGKFRYDRDFLLQFMAHCKEKPDTMPNLEALGLEASEQGGAGNHPMERTRSSRRQMSQSGIVMPPPSNPASRSASGVGLNIVHGFPGKTQAGFPAMPFGGRNAAKMTSEDRFKLASDKPPMVRTASQGGVNGMNAPSGLGKERDRNRSHRGKNRGGGESNAFNQQQNYNNNNNMQAQFSLEPVAPLETSANRWVPGSLTRRPQAGEDAEHELLDRKVKGLLNKLTMERFDSISDQIIDWANKSEKEKDGRTLIRVIRLVFEKATDEATWSEMYARLCRKMLEKISSNVVDESIRSADGKPFAGGQLFRKYLLNRCQEDFERGWQVKENAAVAAAAKADDDSKAAEQANKDGDGESALYSDEYYAAQKAKRRGLGLVKFIGELFKLQMLTERIMHECIKKLLSNVDNPEEEEIESLCKLLSTVGQALDTPKAKGHLDIYFGRMQELANSPKIAPRMQYMLLDVIDLRRRKWVSRTQVAAPSTLSVVHEQAAKEKAAAEKESHNRQIPMSRGGSRRGDHPRDFSGQNSDGWTTAGGPGGPARPPNKAGDLSQFGKINKANGPISMSPGGVFALKRDGKRESSSLSRAPSGANMFAFLKDDASGDVAPGVKTSRPPSRKPSVDFGQNGPPVARTPLNLLPRSVPVAGDDGKQDAAQGSAESGPESEPEEGEIRDGPAVSPEQIKKIEEDVKELFAIRNIEESETYFTNLHAHQRPTLIDKIVSRVLESKEADAVFVAKVFQHATDEGHVAEDRWEEGFSGTMEFLEDISVDAPAAYKLMAILLKGSRIPRETVEKLADKISVDGDPLVLPRNKLLKAYDNTSDN